MPSIIVNGMSCEHCRASVAKAIEAVPGVESVEVSLTEKQASWTETHPVALEAVRKAVAAVGFDPE